jgi:hypothetical protein
MSEIISGIIGAAIGFLGSFLTLKLGYKKLFAETVSNRRMEWIDNFREEFSVFAGTWEYLNEHKSQPAQGGKNEPIAQNENVKRFVVVYKANRSEKESDELKKAEIEARRARAKLLTRLNQSVEKSGNEYNKKFARLLTDMKLDGSGNPLTEQEKMREAIDYARKILEPEWARVKREAKGEEQNV